MKPTVGFLGLNNVADPIRLGLRWLRTADNVVIDRTGAIDRRPGYRATSVAGALSGGYSTKDFTRFYVVLDGDLCQVNPDMTATVLREDVGAAPMHWDEINDVVYFSNGASKGLIYPDGTVRDWGWDVPAQPQLLAVAGNLEPGLYRVCLTYRLPDGRETGSGEAAELELTAGQALQVHSIPHRPGCTARVYITPANSEAFQLAAETSGASTVWNHPPEALGADLLNVLLSPPPAAAVQLAFYAGRAWLMQYVPEQNLTIVWRSLPLAFHLFDLEAGYIAVPGRGYMLAAHAEGLLIGTDSSIQVWNGTQLATLADYGVVPGWPSAHDEESGKAYFWTQRGVCRALPFENLTEGRISVAPGLQVGAALLRRGGSVAFLASLHDGGTAHNPHP